MGAVQSILDNYETRPEGRLAVKMLLVGRVIGDVLVNTEHTSVAGQMFSLWLGYWRGEGMEVNTGQPLW